jgi:hypothetical protein
MYAVIRKQTGPTSFGEACQWQYINLGHHKTMVQTVIYVEFNVNLVFEIGAQVFIVIQVDLESLGFLPRPEKAVQDSLLFK